MIISDNNTVYYPEVVSETGKKFTNFQVVDNTVGLYQLFPLNKYKNEVITDIYVSQEMIDFYPVDDIYTATYEKDTDNNISIINDGELVSPSKSSIITSDRETPSIKEDVTFIDGCSCNDTIIGMNTRTKPYISNKFLGIRNKFDSTDSPFTNNFLLGNGCVKQDNSKPQITSTRSILNILGSSPISDKKPFFYSFFYKKESSIEFTKDLLGKDNPFAFFTIGFSKNITLLHNPDNSLEIHVQNGTPPDKEHDYVYYETYSLSTEGVLKDDAWNHIVLQFYPGQVNSRTVTVMCFINNTVEIIFEANITDAIFNNYITDLQNLTYYKGVNIFTPKNSTQDDFTTSVNLDGNVEKISYNNARYLGNYNNYMYTPDGVKFAQLEYYIGIYNKTNQDLFLSKPQETIYKLKIDFENNREVKNTNFYYSKMPKLFAGMDTQEVTDSKMLEQDTPINFILYQNNYKFFYDEYKISTNIHKPLYIDLKLHYDVEPVEGTHFKYKMVYKKYDLYELSPYIRLTKGDT